MQRLFPIQVCVLKQTKAISQETAESLLDLYDIDVTCCPKCKSKNYNRVSFSVARSPPIKKDN